MPKLTPPANAPPGRLATVRYQGRLLALLLWPPWM
jgi:hypothetical protein